MHDGIVIAMIGVAGVSGAIAKDIWVQVRTANAANAARIEDYEREQAAKAAEAALPRQLEDLTQERDTLRFTSVALPEFLIQQVEKLQDEKTKLENENRVLAADKFTAELHAYELEAEKRQREQP